ENTPLVPMILSSTKAVIRFPVKFMFFVVWCLSIMAARGLHLILNGKLQGFKLSLCFWIGIAFLGALFLSKSHPFDFMLHYKQMAAAKAQLLRLAEPSLGLACLAAAGCGILFCILSRFSCTSGKLKMQYAAHLIVLLSVLSLLYNAYIYCHNPGPADFF